MTAEKELHIAGPIDKGSFELLFRIFFPALMAFAKKFLPDEDGIPALLDPHLVLPETSNFLAEDDLVVGIRIGDKARAYPHSILGDRRVVVVGSNQWSA